MLFIDKVPSKHVRDSDSDVFAHTAVHMALKPWGQLRAATGIAVVLSGGRRSPARYRRLTARGSPFPRPATESHFAEETTLTSP